MDGHIVTSDRTSELEIFFNVIHFTEEAVAAQGNNMM